MESINRKQAFVAPAAVFQHPLRVVSNGDLSHDEKLVVLRNWKQALEQQQQSDSSQSSDFDRLEMESRLAAVNDALNSLHKPH